MTGLRVLVTGGAGFIGSHVVDALRDAGHQVRILDCLLPAAHRGRPGYLDEQDTLIGDVRDADAVRAALAGVDVVCHQAAMVGLGVSAADLPDYVGCNDLGTAVLLAGMAEAGRRAAGAGQFDGGVRGGQLPVPDARADPARSAPPRRTWTPAGSSRRARAAGPS